MLATRPIKVQNRWRLCTALVCVTECEGRNHTQNPGST